MHVNIKRITFVIRIITDMKERILEFLRRENKTSAQFAEEIGVQPSGISHILSGRNNPSLDFVIRMLGKYPFISTGWLLFGKGSMYTEPSLATLFDETGIGGPEKPEENPGKTTEKAPEIKQYKPVTAGFSDGSAEKRISEIKKIVWFYADNSFEEFFPHKV
jgi:transcriptional regulator with XRE-family HTH domain